MSLAAIGPTEVGGFGISNADDLLSVEDIQLVEQVCSVVSVEFNDDSVADFFDQQVDAGRQPEQFARIWIHTHPGASPLPSGTERRLRSRVEFDREFPAADHDAWFIEYCDNVTVYDPFSSRHTFADTYFESVWWEHAPSATDRWSDSLWEAVS